MGHLHHRKIALPLVSPAVVRSLRDHAIELYHGADCGVHIVVGALLAQALLIIVLSLGKVIICREIVRIALSGVSFT